MTQDKISEAAKARAHEMIATTPEGMLWSTTAEYALARFIQQVSDAATEGVKQLRIPHAQHCDCFAAADRLAPFILPEPVDPLTDAVIGVFGEGYAGHVEMLRKAFDKRGLKIVEAP